MDENQKNYKMAQNCAAQIRMKMKGRYLEQISPADLSAEDEGYVPEITRWYRLGGFRKPHDDIYTGQCLQRAVREWIMGMNGNGGRGAFALRKKSGELSVLYGNGNEHSDVAFRTNLPECRIFEEQWIDTEYRYNGLLTGTICSEKTADSFAVSGITDGYLSCIIRTVSGREVQEKIEENKMQTAYLERYKAFRRVYGNASRRVEEIPILPVVQAIEELKEETEYLEQNISCGIVKTAVKFGAATRADYRILSSLIQSCMKPIHERTALFEVPRFFELDLVCDSWRDCLAVPSVMIGHGFISEKIYPFTIQDAESAVSFCMPPIHSYEGYYIKNYEVDETEPEAFPITEPANQEGVEIGTVKNSGRKAVIPYAALHSHAFITGATETGKTTTVKKILKGLYTSGIPFTVIEAAKKEYISLAENIPELKVYTPGHDGIKLQLNPLQPEDGVLIENHVAAVVRALAAATGGEHPIPEAYEGLLKQTYQICGWEYGMMAYSDERRPFPTFRDVFDNVDSYIENHAKYGPEVRQNLTAALTLRTENMQSGAMGSIFEKADGLKAKDFLNVSCVIELADFSLQSASFLMNILLFRLQSYLSRQPECGRLKQVIVLEEAHNIFKRTAVEDSGRALNNEYFEKMLAEIRSSGTGVILSDQRPRILSEAVIANTSVKIFHALVDGEDRKTVQIPGNLSEFQMKKLGEFQAGECVLVVRGQYGVQHVMVEAVKEERKRHSACHVCTSRFRCRREAVRKILYEMDAAVVSFHAAKIQSDPYDIPTLEKRIDCMLRELDIAAADATKLCLLGEMLATYGSVSEQEQRIIATAYSNYLKRSRNNE